jgi:hypothetical protein
LEVKSQIVTTKNFHGVITLFASKKTSEAQLKAGKPSSLKENGSPQIS